MKYNPEQALPLAHDVIRLLNEATQLDRGAINALVQHRVPCNKELAAHPTIQVRTEHKSNTSGACALVESHLVGLLGILNGIIGTDEFGNAYVIATYGDNKELIKFVLNPNLGKEL